MRSMTHPFGRPPPDFRVPVRLSDGRVLIVQRDTLRYERRLDSPPVACQS